MHACKEDQCKVVQILVNAGAEKDFQDHKVGRYCHTSYYNHSMLFFFLV